MRAGSERQQIAHIRNRRMKNPPIQVRTDRRAILKPTPSHTGKSATKDRRIHHMQATRGEGGGLPITK
jgi:hypothetical protein